MSRATTGILASMDTSDIPTAEQMRAHAKRWMIHQTYPIFVGVDSHLNEIEALVHDLAHLAALGDPMPSATSDLLCSCMMIRTHVSARINAELLTHPRTPYAGRYYSPHRRDSNEIEALAISVRVFDLLGLPLPRTTFYAHVRANLSLRANRSAIHIRVERCLARPTTDTRARALLASLCAPPIPYTSRGA